MSWRSRPAGGGGTDLAGQYGMVVTYACASSIDEHERATHSAVARTLAALLGRDFAGEYDASRRYGAALYFVPSDTLVLDEARALGIRGKEDLFGGVVPYAFAATKVIAHPLVAGDAQAPRGWSPSFAERVHEVVLPGFTAFSVMDARRAGLALLEHGPIRLKPGWGVGGHSQRKAADRGALDHALHDLDAAAIGRHGLALEMDLAETATYSIGQVWAAGMQATYCGTQRTTLNHRGGRVFGGSDLVVARGGFDALEELELDEAMRIAIRQATLFDSASAEFPGFLASRRNYDAVRGRDRQGRWRSAILEQSWRIGGASGPEVAALAAFRADPGLRAVRARSTERYDGADPPPGAIVHFSGVDRRVGRISKYTVVEAYEPA